MSITSLGVRRSEPDAVARCASCEEPRPGRYCSRCGERALDPDALTVRHFVTHTLLPETLDLDGKVWRTLRGLLFRPGFLSAEYCRGRRRLYVGPLRLLLIAIVLYALAAQGGLQVSLFVGRFVLSIAPTAVPRGASVEETVRRIDRLGVLQGLAAAKARSGALAAEGARERFQRRLEQFAQPLSFTNVLLLALVLHGLFRRKRGLFVEHGVFSMHLVSFVLLSSLIFVPLPWMLQAGWQTIVSITIAGGVIWQFAYLAVAVRRFYFGQDPRGARPVLWATATALLIYALNSVFVTGVQLLGGALALWSV